MTRPILKIDWKVYRQASRDLLDVEDILTKYAEWSEDEDDRKELLDAAEKAKKARYQMGLINSAASFSRLKPFDEIGEWE